MREHWARVMDLANHVAPVRRAKLEIKCLLGKQLRPVIDERRATVLLGANYKVSWAIDPTLLSEESVVYSCGIGEDISFDLCLIQRYGLTVNAFDPTPESIRWLEAQHKPDRFHFHPVGIAGHDGTISLHKQSDIGDDVSMSALRGDPKGKQVVPVKRISTIMGELGHRHIDLLKMDIEGCEYDVIEDILENRLSIRQLLIEFHHRWPEIGHARTQTALSLLRSHGYRIFAASGLWDEYSLVAAPDDKR